MEEMISDTFEGLEDDDLEELADTEVEKVLFEITSGECKNRGNVMVLLPCLLFRSTWRCSYSISTSASR